MLSAERLLRIREMIERNSFVSVKEIMDTFHISRSSAMRDLIELENQGIAVRERGGAVLKNISVTLTTMNERAVQLKEGENEEAKRKICQEAAKSIQEGDCIYIDAGSTTIYLIDFLKNMKVTIITPSTYFIHKLPSTFPGTIYLLGGEYTEEYGSSYGPLTIQMLKQFNFDQAFMTTNGINLENGEVSVFNFQIGAVKKEVLKRCPHNKLLVDYSKTKVNALCTWAHLEDFQGIYIDAFYAENMPDNFVVS